MPPKQKTRTMSAVMQVQPPKHQAQRNATQIKSPLGIYSGDQGNAPIKQKAVTSIFVDLTTQNKLSPTIHSGGSRNDLISQKTTISNLVASSIEKQFPSSISLGGENNASINQKTMASNLVAASTQHKFPHNISSGNENNASISHKTMASNLTTASLQKISQNKNSILAPSSVQNRLLLSMPSDVPVKKRRPRGPSVLTTTTSRGEGALQSRPTYPNTEINHQVFISNEVVEAITRAEEVLESTQADPNREADRQVHISNEVLEAHYEEMNESDSNCAATSFTSNSTLRKTRGPTQETAITPPKGEKWKCLIIDGQPVGQAASKLAIVLGLYARMEAYFPPYKQWKDQSPQSFNDVMKDITKDYDFVDLEGMPASMMVVTSFCQESLKKKLRDWRCWLKKHYYIEGVHDEVLVNVPDKRITQVNWESLLRYWKSDNKVLEAERNKRNRGEDRPTHTLGAKSIARHNQDEREKLGDDYTTLGAYLRAHQTKNGDYPNEYTRVMCEKVVTTCVERDIMNSSEPCVLSPILDIVYKGHHGGYERGRGLGWSRAMCWSKMEIHASNENLKHLTVELQNARFEIEAMHAREKEMEVRQLEQIEAMKAQEREMQERERGMQESNREMKERLERMEALLSMHFFNGSVGGGTANDGASHSQLPR